MAHPYLSVQAEKESGLSDKLVGFAEKGITNAVGPVGAPRVCVPKLRDSIFESFLLTNETQPWERQT
jgi:hypothetical protein